MDSEQKPKMVILINTFWMTKNYTDIWCAFSQRNRTNNIIESYRSQITKIFKKTWSHGHTPAKELTVLKILENISLKKRNNLYVDNDDDILVMFVQMHLVNKKISTGLEA